MWVQFLRTYLTLFCPLENSFSYSRYNSSPQLRNWDESYCAVQYPPHSEPDLGTCDHSLRDGLMLLVALALVRTFYESLSITINLNLSNFFISVRQWLCYIP